MIMRKVSRESSPIQMQSMFWVSQLQVSTAALFFYEKVLPNHVQYMKALVSLSLLACIHGDKVRTYDFFLLRECNSEKA